MMPPSEHGPTTVDQAKAAKRVANAMDAAIVVVAALTMSFSFGNIHQFALQHGTADPIAWFPAPAIDLALIGALMGDAYLSRHGLDAGPWAKALRWFAGLATLALNTWESVAARDAAAILLHASMPVLLFCLAEAAVPYRQRFAEVVRRAAVEAATRAATAPATPAVQAPQTAAEPFRAEQPAPEVAAEVDQVAVTAATDTATPATVAATPAEPEVEPQLTEGATAPATLADEPAPVAGEDDPEDNGLDQVAARDAIERGWVAGWTVNQTATEATRSRAYVSKVWKQLTEERGPRPVAGQLTLVKATAEAG